MPTTSTPKTKSPVLFVILVLFFLFLVAGLAGVYFMRSFNVSTLLPTLFSGIVGAPAFSPRATENDFSFIEDSLLRKHMAAQANQATFRIRSRDAVSAKGFFTVFEVQMAGDEMSYANWQELQGKKSGELISIAKTTYVKDYKDNTWWKQTEEPEEKSTVQGEPLKEPMDFKQEYEDLKTKPPTFEKLGEESCGLSSGSDRMTCYKYREKDSENPEASRLFWFDTKKLLLRKEETGYGEWRATNEDEYDGVNVKAPTPTKEVPKGKSIYEYMTVGEPAYFQLSTGGETKPTSPQKIKIPTEIPEGPFDQMDYSQTMVEEPMETSETE